MGISATPDWTPGSNYRFAVQYYYIPSRYSKLIKTETFHYNDNEKHLLARMSYKYDPETQLIVEKTNVRSNQDSIIQKFRYPKDYQSSEPYLSMYNKRIWNAEIQRSIFINDTLSNPVYSIQHTYKTWNGYDNHIFPFETMVKASENVSFEKFSEILRYDGFGNPVEIKKQNGNTTVYIWGYSGKYPVAKIENATYTSVLSVLGYYYTDAQVRLNLLNASSVTETFIQTTIESIRQELRGSLVTTYTYSPFSGMTSMTDPRGNTEYYQYDGFQRLRTVLDAEHNVLEYYQYHYKP